MNYNYKPLLVKANLLDAFDAISKNKKQAIFKNGNQIANHGNVVNNHF